MEGDTPKCHLGKRRQAQSHPHTRHWQSGSKFRGRDSQQRALVCQVGAEVTGDGVSTSLESLE